MVWAALGGVVGAVSPAGVRKAAAGVGHGAAHLLLLVADARKAPGVRAVQEQEGGDEEQGDAVVLARSMSFSEENDSKPLTESLNFSELDTDCLSLFVCLNLPRSFSDKNDISPCLSPIRPIHIVYSLTHIVYLGHSLQPVSLFRSHGDPM